MEDFDYFPDDDEESEASAEEGSNRAFIIAVGVLGGLLAIGICAFVIWIAVIYPRINSTIAQNDQTFATYEAATASAQAVAEGTEGATTTPAVDETETPTRAADTDTPTPTREAELTEEGTVLPGTGTPTPQRAAQQGTASPSATAALSGQADGDTPTVTRTRKPTATRTPAAVSQAGDDAVPDTGFSVVGAGVLALGLLFLLAIVRRIRQTA